MVLALMVMKGKKLARCHSLQGVMDPVFSVVH